MKDLILRSRVVVRTSNLKISRRHLAYSSKNWTKERAARTARLFFLVRPMTSLIFDIAVAVVAT